MQEKTRIKHPLALWFCASYIAVLAALYIPAFLFDLIFSRQAYYPLTNGLDVIAAELISLGIFASIISVLNWMFDRIAIPKGYYEWNVPARSFLDMCVIAFGTAITIQLSVIASLFILYALFYVAFL